MIPPQDEGWFHLPSMEWVIGATWTVGAVVTAFVWRLTLRVALLERTATEREAAIERRHQENLVAWKELREQIARLTERIDRLMDR